MVKPVDVVTSRQSDYLVGTAPSNDSAEVGKNVERVLDGPSDMGKMGAVHVW